MFKAKVLFLLMCFLTLPSMASLIEGTVSSIDKNKICIQLENPSNHFQVTSEAPNLTKNLLSLKVGDFISAEGSINILNNTVKLVAIKYVGIRRLLGSWESLNKERFVFTDFNTLKYTAFNEVDGHITTSIEKTIQYHITPDGAEESWPILFTDNISSGTGRIKIQNRQILLTLFNLNGNKAREITLVPKFKK